MFKDVSAKIKLVVAYNIFSILFCLSFCLRDGFILRRLLLDLFLGLPLLILSYLLLKKVKPAFYLILIWFALQTFTFKFPNFSFFVFYGLQFDLHIMNSPIGFNPITFTMFVILFSARKEIISPTPPSV